MGTPGKEMVLVHDVHFTRGLDASPPIAKRLFEATEVVSSSSILCLPCFSPVAFIHVT